MLAICTIVPALGLSANLLWPAPTHGYEAELALLIILGVLALWLTRHTIKAAVFLYCVLALFPVGSMLEYHASKLGGTGAWLMGVPLVGLLMVGALTGCSWATAAYIPVAITGGLFAGGIYSNEGAMGALAGGALIIGIIAIIFCQKWQARDMLSSATGRIDSIQRGLDQIQEEINGR